MIPRRMVDFDSDKLSIRGKGGILGTATAGQTTNFEYKFTENRLITGGILLLEDQAFGDKVHFEVVDKDNILGYGTNVVLERFIEDWYVNWKSCEQPKPDVRYPALVLQDLYLRIIYISVGSTNVKVAFDIEGHKIKI